MTKILVTLFFSLAIISCSKEIETDKPVTEPVQVDSSTVDKVKKKIDKVEDQVAQLKRIIEINKSQLEEYQTKIAEGDTLELKGLPLYVEDLKKAIKLKEERLEKLKRK